MKRWAIVLISITLCLGLNNMIYATDDVAIYEEPQVQHKGRIEMNFYSTDSIEHESKDFVVKSVQIELYYRHNKVMQNVKDLDMFIYTDLTLTSDENGKIILSNLPYGLYEYKIVSAPTGIKYDSLPVKIDLNLMNETILKDIYLVKEIVMAEGTTENIEEPEVEIEKEEPKVEFVPQVEKVETNTVIIIGQKNEEAITKDINNLASNMYQAMNPQAEVVPLTENKDIMQKVATELIKEAKEEKVDRIKEMRKVRITDQIKVAVLDMDDTMYYLKNLSDKQNDNNNKMNGTKRKMWDRDIDKKYKHIRVSKITNIRTTMVA